MSPEFLKRLDPKVDNPVCKVKKNQKCVSSAIALAEKDSEEDSESEREKKEDSKSKEEKDTQRFIRHLFKKNIV